MAMALLGQMQSLLAALYDAPIEHDVHDYLITDPAHAAALQESAASPGTDEQLLIAATDDGMELGLYLDASVLERLGRRCPLIALDESNLGDYCTALEGVSHFHYVTWSAGCDRRVSLLELDAGGSRQVRRVQPAAGQRGGASRASCSSACSRVSPPAAPDRGASGTQAHRCAAILRAARTRFCAGDRPPRGTARGVTVVLRLEPRQARHAAVP
jgi:hypothetical protein